MAILDFIRSQANNAGKQVSTFVNRASDRYNPFDKDNAVNKVYRSPQVQNNPMVQFQNRAINTVRKPVDWGVNNIGKPVNVAAIQMADLAARTSPVNMAYQGIKNPQYNPMGELTKENTLIKNDNQLTKLAFGNDVKTLGSRAKYNENELGKMGVRGPAGQALGFATAAGALALDAIPGGDDAGKAVAKSIAKSTAPDVISKLAKTTDPALIKKLVAETDPKKVSALLKSSVGKVDVPKTPEVKLSLIKSKLQEVRKSAGELAEKADPGYGMADTSNTLGNKVYNEQFSRLGGDKLEKEFQSLYTNIQYKNKEGIYKNLSKPSTEAFDPQKYIQEQEIAKKTASKGPSVLDNIASAKKEVLNKFQDRFNVIEDVLTKSEKQNKLSILPTKDIRPQLDRVLRSESIATNFSKENGLFKVIQDSPDVKALDQYLIAKQALDVSQNGIKTGRDLVKDQQLIDSLSPQMENQAQALYQYSRALLKRYVDDGMLSKYDADFLIKKYPNYVPLERVFSAAEQGGVGNKISAVASVGTQKGVRKLVGSEREIASPIESMIAKTKDMIDIGEKNKAAQMLVSYKDLPGNPFNIKPITKIAPGEGSISVFINGKKQMFEIDPEIAKAAKSMGKAHIGLLGQIFAVPTRILKLGATGLNIPFAASNVVKDQVFSTITSSKALKTSIANPDNFVKSLYAALGQNKLYDDWVKSGASFTSYDMSRNAATQTVSRIKGDKNIGTRVLYDIKHPQDILRSVENIIGKSEEVTRIQQFNGMKQALMKEGRTEADATILAQQASNANTANFARSGEWMVPINAAIPYINAGIRGATSLAHAFKVRPAATTAKVAGLVFLPIYYATQWNTSDPQRRAAYDDIPDYEKDNNIIIMPPNPVKDESGRWNAMKIPLTPGLSNLGSIVRRQIEGINSLGKTATDLVAAGTSFDVSSGSKLLSTLTPQIIKPFVESATNTSLFTGQKIVPEYMKNYPPEMQVRENTSGTSRIIGKALNTSPLKVDNTIRSTMAGVGQQAVNLSDTLLNKAGIIPKEQVGGKSIAEQVSNRFTSAAGGQQLNNVFEGKSNTSASQTPVPGQKSSNPNIVENKGKFYTNVDGTPRSFETQAKAEQALNASDFKKSGDSSRVIGDTIYYRSGDEVKTINKTEYELKIGDKKFASDKDRLTRAKDTKGLITMYEARNKDLYAKRDKLNPETQMDLIMQINNNIEDNNYAAAKLKVDPLGGSGGGGKKASYKVSYKGPSYKEVLAAGDVTKKVSLGFKGIEKGGSNGGSGSPKKRLGKL